MAAEVISRRARKEWPCAGDGATTPKRAEGCTGAIPAGDLYIENLDSTPAYQSGTRHCLACAERFLGVDVQLVVESRAKGCKDCGGRIDEAGRCEACGAVQ